MFYSINLIVIVKHSYYDIPKSWHFYLIIALTLSQACTAAELSGNMMQNKLQCLLNFISTLVGNLPKNLTKQTFGLNMNESCLTITD